MAQWFRTVAFTLYKDGPREDFLTYVSDRRMTKISGGRIVNVCWIEAACQKGDHEALQVADILWFARRDCTFITFNNAIKQCPNARKRNQCWRALAARFFETEQCRWWDTWSVLWPIAANGGDPFIPFCILRQKELAREIIDASQTPIQLHEKYHWSLEAVSFVTADEALFALVVFYTDAYLIFVRVANDNFEKKIWEMRHLHASFFRIAAQLPLDLQMVLCNRALGSDKDVITSTMSEPAFRALAVLFFDYYKLLKVACKNAPRLRRWPCAAGFAVGVRGHL
jgi:hypothetical protein